MAFINSNRTFLDMRDEPVWGDEGAVVAAATQLDIAAASGGETMAGLVVPSTPRAVRIDFTDGDSSISAFTVTVIGLDAQGVSQTEVFVFADGLDQTGTQRFASLTTVTLTAITGNGAGDTLDLNWDTNPELIPVLGGDYGVSLDDPVREQQHTQGDQDAFYSVQDRRNLGGGVKVGLWPHLSKRLLNYATVRSSGELWSMCLRDDIPGIEARVHAGMKVNDLSLEGSSESDLTMSLDLMGRHEGTEANLTYPGAYVVPDVPSLTFKNSRFVISLNAGGDDGFANPISPVGLSSFSLSLHNNLKQGPPVEYRVDLEKDGIPAYLTAGRNNMDVRFTATFDRQEYMTLQRSRLYAQFMLLAAHPAWSVYGTVAAAGATAGSAVAVPLTADVTASFAVGDVVMFDNAGGSSLPCVGQITAIVAGNVTIDVLDANVVSADHMFNAALELRTAPIRVSATTIQRNFDDTLLVEVSGQIFSGGAAPLTYKCKDMTLP